MRKAIYWTGWSILFLLPIAYGVEIALTEDLPHVQLWKWAILAAAVLLIYVARDRDDVLRHHLA